MRTIIAMLAMMSVAFCQPAGVKALYVTNNTTGTVTAFSVSPEGVLTTIGVYPAGNNPQDVGITANGRNLIVVNATAATIEEIYTFRINNDGSLTRNNTPSTIGDGPLSLNVTASGFLLVPSATNDNLTSFNIQNDATSVINTAAAGAFPTKVVSTGNFAYCTGTSGGPYIAKFNIAPNGALSVIGTPTTMPNGSAQGAVVHPNGRVLYVSSALGNYVRAHTIEPDGELTMINDANSGGNSCVELAIHPNGEWLYVCNVVSDTLTVMPINPDGSLQASTQSYLIGSDIRDVITDGQYVYVTDESTLGSSLVGVVVFRIEPNFTLTRLETYVTGGGRPQHMALWNPPKLGDVNRDGIVDDTDLARVLEAFGTSRNIAEDLNADGVVDDVDLAIVLENFGA
ncbi:MAG: beta-propeller fold lactonase family protein [Armatimonadetes bacterium]|nr:beta-propeller fold lactonase family protein [Armatimonadota bacterium]